jgi:hypothetical protein
MPSPFVHHGLVGDVPLRGDISSFLQERGETGIWVYQEDVLRGAVKTTQEWLRRNIPAFISTQDWPSGSPDLNPLDYKLWAVLEDMACQKRHNNLDSLKRNLVKAAADIPLETVLATIAEWPEHLTACVEVEGGHFEWHCYK